MSVVVLGAGSTGEAFAAALRRLDADVPIAIVERKLVGGECSYYACMPTKALLRPGEALAAARNVPGAAEAATGSLDTERVFWHRDQVTSGWDDSGQESFLTELDVELVRGEGRVVEPGLVRVDDRDLPYEKLVIATGSVAAVPPIPGLAESAYWTNRDATTTREIPESIVVLGAGPVGCSSPSSSGAWDLGWRSSTSGTTCRHATIPRLAGILQEALAGEDIALHLGVKIERVEERGSESFRLTLEGGDVVKGEKLLVATGRKANGEGFGFEQLGLTIGKTGIDVDERLRAAKNVSAIGDVNGIAMFTHVGKYQARVAAAERRGPRDARRSFRCAGRHLHRPAGGLVGETSGKGLATSTWKVNATARASTYERPKHDGLLKVFADPERGVLVGAVAVGPEAGEWLGQLRSR